MKHTITLLTALLLAPLAGFNLSADAATPASPGVQTLSAGQAILDLRQMPWQYIHDTTTNKLEEVRARNDWKSVTVGRSWDLAGHSELRKGVVWVRTRVFVPAELRGDRITFFCTALGGSGNVYVNGSQVGQRVRYAWAHDVAGPFRIELTDALRYGEENELLVRCDPAGSVRSIGLLGLVCLQRTIPFHRSDDGGMVLDRPMRGSLCVLLHYSDAVLARGNQTEFRAEELATLRIPIYGLREDELISVVSGADRNAARLHKVDVALLHFTADNRAPSIRCDALPTNVKQSELLCVPIQVTGTYRNPFEPKEVDVTAEIRTPSGKTETVNAFFSQDYEPVKVGEHEEILLPIRGSGTPWRFNYRPRETGRHTVRLAVKDRTGQAMFDAGGFEVTPKAARGFLRVSKNDPRFFEFDNGESFYGTGPSGWFRQTENWMFGGNTRWIPIEPLKKYYERKGASRSTYEYLARWHFGQLYLKGGSIDNYVAWKLDAAVRAMEANGVYWITYGRPASGRTYYNNVKWGRNVMSTQPQIIRQNGLPSIEELGFEPGGRIELFHFVSRLADSPAIWLWNCAEEDGTFNPEVLPYHDYIRSLDVYRHPHGVSEGVDSLKHGSDVVLLPDWYNGTFERCASTYAKLTGIQSPVLDVEGSVNTAMDLTGIVERLDRITAGYHNHLWLCLFMKLACGGTEWFNVELDDGNRLVHAKAIAKFLDGEHLTKTRWEIAKPEISDSQLRAFALRSAHKTLAWVVIPPAKDPIPAVKGAVLKIPVTAPGAYRLEFWDTAKGTVTSTRVIEAAGGFVTCALPEVCSDLAFKASAVKKPCQASQADDVADAARMAAQANLSFEQAAGPETQYVVGFNRDQRLPWISLLGGRKDWPAGWVVRNLTDNEGKRTLVLPKREEVKTAAAPFALVDGTGRAGSKALQITGDPAGRVFTMGEVGFPVIPLRNYFKGKEIEIELKGWVKGADANAADKSRVGLEFSQHSALQYGSRASNVERIPTGTFGWTPINVKAKVKPEAGRWARIMIDAAGNTGKLSFDDFSLTINGEDAFALLAKVRDWRDGTTANSTLQATLPESVIWTEDPSQKVFGWSRPPEREASPGIELSAAKGEYESFQIAFQPLKDLENISVAFSDLEGPRPWYYFGRPMISKVQLEVREVALVKRSQQWDFIDHTGMIPDPLRPGKSFTFKAGASRSLWVTVHVPQNTPAGEYSGSIKIGGPLNLDMPIKLKVRNFALPELTSFNLNAEVKPRAIALYDKRPWLEVMRDYFPDMAAHRARVTNFEIFPIPVVKEGKVSLDPASLAESDATIDYAKSLGFHTFTTSKSPFYLGGAAQKKEMGVSWKDTPWAAQKFDTGVSRTAPEFPRIYGDYLNLTANHYRDKGTIGNVLQYIFDEPFLWAKTPEQKQMVNQFYAISKKAGYRNFLTTSPNAEYTDIDVWCPLYHHAIGHKEENEKAKKNGQSVIWYHNEFYTINRSALNARLVGWFTWRYQFDAYLIWSINYWASGNPWEESKLDGDGYLIYPNPAGEGKPCSSIRWELMREGIEDYDYFVLLKNRADAVIGKASSSPEKTAKAKEALKLLKEIEELIPNDSTTLNYNQDPVDYANLRERMAAAIEAMTP